jgi:hypothetical protein
MKITLDSTEPLEDALRVLGAMYGVRLVVAGDVDATRPIEDGASKTAPTPEGQNRQGSGSKQSRPNAAKATPGSGRSGGRSVSGASGRATNAEVRAWARENGLRVSDRGRLPGAVMAAYRSANGK